MKKKPEVYLVGQTTADIHGLSAYLRAVGAPEWCTDAHSDHDMLAEVAGRLCYRAFGTELNPNVTRVREGNAKYLANVLAQGHGSIFEHCSVNIIFRNVTRVFTHELVRHRVGMGYSQESLRFVRLDDLDHYQPDGDAYPDLTDKMAELSSWQKEMAEEFGLDGMAMVDKKKFTSFMRRVAPMGLCTSIMMTANHRILRHIIKMRTEMSAEVEIREVFGEVARIVKEKFPNTYQDMEHDASTDEWTFRNPKV